MILTLILTVTSSQFNATMKELFMKFTLEHTVPEDVMAYLVSIRVHTNSVKRYSATEHICGGTLLSRNKVLTAGHCFYQ